MISPVLTFQSLTVWSLLAEAIVWPSGLKATELIESACPDRARRKLPVLASQSLTVWSPLAEAIICPFGLKTTELIESEWPEIVEGTITGLTSESFTLSLSKTMVWPLGVKGLELNGSLWGGRGLAVEALLLFRGLQSLSLLSFVNHNSCSEKGTKNVEQGFPAKSSSIQIWFPESTSQTLRTPSTAPESSIFPSKLKATVTTFSLCPSKALMADREAISQSVTKPFLAPDANQRVSELKAKDVTIPENPSNVAKGFFNCDSFIGG